MTTHAATAVLVETAPRPLGHWRLAWRRLRRDRVAVASGIFLAVALFAVIPGPIVTMLGMDVGMAVGIALYIETVFALPGLGRTTIAALAGNQGFDLPVILGVTLVVAAAIIVLNLLADLVLLALDPRISAGGRRGSIVGRLV